MKHESVRRVGMAIRNKFSTAMSANDMTSPAADQLEESKGEQSHIIGVQSMDDIVESNQEENTDFEVTYGDDERSDIPCIVRISG